MTELEIKQLRKVAPQMIWTRLFSSDVDDPKKERDQDTDYIVSLLASEEYLQEHCSLHRISWEHVYWTDDLSHSHYFGNPTSIYRDFEKLKDLIKELLPLVETDPACLTDDQLDREEDLIEKLRAITEG